MIALAPGLTVLVAVLAAIIVLILCELAAIAIIKIRREGRETSESAVAATLTDHLLDVIDGDEPKFRVIRRRVFIGRKYFDVAAPRGLSGRATRETLLSLIATISGEGRARLVGILEEAGYVERTLRLLRSRDAVARTRGCMLLGGMMSNAAVEPLSRVFLEDRDPAVRLAAAEALGQIGHPPSVEVLLGALHNRTRWQHVRIANVLSQMGFAAVPALQRALREPDDKIVLLALDILSDIGLLDGFHDVVALLHHHQPEIRARAVELLGIVGAVELLGAVVRATNDEQWFVRVRAVKALQRLGIPDDPALEERYFSTLTELLGDPSWWVRQHAADALAHAGERGERILRTVDSDASTSALQLYALREGKA